MTPQDVVESISVYAPSTDDRDAVMRQRDVVFEDDIPANQSSDR
jgi:hypothetical protein